MYVAGLRPFAAASGTPTVSYREVDAYLDTKDWYVPLGDRRVAVAAEALQEWYGRWLVSRATLRGSSVRDVRLEKEEPSDRGFIIHFTTGVADGKTEPDPRVASVRCTLNLNPGICTPNLLRPKRLLQSVLTGERCGRMRTLTTAALTLLKPGECVVLTTVDNAVVRVTAGTDSCLHVEDLELGELFAALVSYLPTAAMQRQPRPAIDWVFHNLVSIAELGEGERFRPQLEGLARWLKFSLKWNER